jgi:hypothetical protein
LPQAKEFPASVRSTVSSASTKRRAEMHGFQEEDASGEEEPPN